MVNDNRDNVSSSSMRRILTIINNNNMNTVLRSQTILSQSNVLKVCIAMLTMKIERVPMSIEAVRKYVSLCVIRT